MDRTKLKNLIRRIAPLIGIAVFITVWAIAAAVVNDVILLPSPTQSVKAFFVLMVSPTFLRVVSATLLRAGGGFVLSLASAIICTIFSLLSKVVERALSPLIVIVRAVPTMSVILLMLLWINSDVNPALVGALISFPVLYSALMGSARGIDENLIEMSKVYKVPTLKKVTSLYIPCMVPMFSQQCASTASLNLKVVISGEVLASTAVSMGREMNLAAKVYFETPTLFAWTAVAVIFSFLGEMIIKGLFRLMPGGKS